MNSTSPALRLAQAQLQLSANAVQAQALIDFREKLLKIKLSDFVEGTSGVKLDPWQYHMCERLEKLRWQKGQRVLLHAPPQLGKSIIVSQRLTPYLLGHDPQMRVKLACYNIDRSKKHTKLARDIMTTPSYKRIFEDRADELYVSPNAPEKEWSTRARIARRDGQSSMMALGLVTGFVGEGADLLIIDDPYASPEQARSKIENKKICDFYPEVANVRITEETNVVVMFHRYTENDIAGSLLATGSWEYLRYAAEADGEYEEPTTKVRYSDPMGREDGERLTARRSDKWYKDQKANTYVWLSQFQGRPTAKEGNLFLVSQIKTIGENEVPAGLRRVRAWDLAGTPGGGDYTAGILMAGPDEDGFFYILDVKRGQWASNDRDKIILDTADADGARTRISLPKEPAQAGIDQMIKFKKLLAGRNVVFRPPTGDKETRAENWISAVNLGSYRAVRAPWLFDLKEELRAFPTGSFDDQVDAGGDAHNELTNRKVGRVA